MARIFGSQDNDDLTGTPEKDHEFLTKVKGVTAEQLQNPDIFTPTDPNIFQVS
jgi:hypothetical protein